MRHAALAAALAALVAGCAGGDDEPETAAAPALGGWVRVEPGGKTRCARGGPYAFWTREGDSKKLVIFFEGGGGCFSEETCVEGSPWFDDDVGPDDDPSVEGGMMDLADTSNPFRGWSWVFVPSCTGDVHVGDARVHYGSIVVEQRGWQNARAALERAFRDFPDVEQVLVTGCSAGSVGSAWHVDEVIRRYPDAQVTQVGDSLAYIFHRPIRLTDWGANKHFPPFFRVGNRRWTMEQFMTRLTRAHPDVTFARFNYDADQVQARFYEAVGGRPADFEGRLRAVEERLKRLPNYRSYLACGTLHCALPAYDFSTLRVKGVALSDWVHDLAEGRDVGCPTCPG